jgi:gas vesicle protein
MDLTHEQFAAEISQQLSGVEERLGTEIANQLSGVEKRLAADISKQLSNVEERLGAHVSRALAQATTELKRQGQIYKEELKDEVKLAAEGYSATLEGIERRLTEISTTFATKFGDHDLVLADHNKRITKLEEHL